MKSTDRTAPTAPESPRQAYLERVVEHLHQAGNQRGVIRLTERWTVATPGATGRPTRRALLLEIRACIDLRVMDRAALRIQELLEAEPDDLEAVALSSEMLIERGRSVQARRILEDALARHPEQPTLKNWLAIAQGPPREVPANAHEIERSGSPDQILALAERLLATGSTLQARNVLERLRRQLPRDARIRDLLWGLQGDFENRDISADELARQLAPELGTPDDGPENTDHGSMEDVTAAHDVLDPSLLEDAAEPEFPALFRRVVPGPLPLMDDDTAEVTQKATMSSLDELGQVEATGDVAPARPRHEDTEIMMVIGGNVSAAPTDASLHTRKKQDYNLKETLNLDEYRREMGMGGGPSTSAPSLPGPARDIDDDDPADSEQEEDEDLVIVTRRDADPRSSTSPAPEERPAPRPPMRVIEKRPVPVIPPSSHTPARPGPASDFHEEVTVVTPPPRLGPRWPLFTSLLILLVVGIVLGTFEALHRTPSDGELAHDAIQADSYTRIQAAEAVIARNLAHPAAPDTQAAMGRIYLALWDDYVNDPQRLTDARTCVGQALAAPVPVSDAWLAAAELALIERRVGAAREAMARVDDDNPDRWLAEARADDIEGDYKSAAEHARKALEMDRKGVRSHRILAEILLHAGDIDGARVAIQGIEASEDEHLRAEIVALLIRLQGVTPEQVASGLDAMARRLVEQEAPARIQAALFKYAAKALQDMKANEERRESALSQAFARDPTDPDLLIHFALKDMEDEHLKDAMARLRQAVGLRPGDIQAQTSLLAVLMGLDRLDEAGKTLDAAVVSIPDHPRLPILKAWVQGVGREDAEGTIALLEPFLAVFPDDPEARWLLGYTLAVTGRDEQALRILAASPATDPLTLSARVLAGDPDRKRLEPQALTLGPRNPWVYLLLAWTHERQGRPSRASAYFDQGVELVPEFARLSYERGRFYALDDRDPILAREAWARYLSLQPSGPRATAARKAAGRP